MQIHGSGWAFVFFFFTFVFLCCLQSGLDGRLVSNFDIASQQGSLMFLSLSLSSAHDYHDRHNSMRFWTRGLLCSHSPIVINTEIWLYLCSTLVIEFTSGCSINHITTFQKPCIKSKRHFHSHSNFNKNSSYRKQPCLRSSSSSGERRTILFVLALSLHHHNHAIVL